MYKPGQEAPEGGVPINQPYTTGGGIIDLLESFSFPSGTQTANGKRTSRVRIPNDRIPFYMFKRLTSNCERGIT